MSHPPLSSALESILLADDLALPLSLPVARQGLQMLAGNPSQATVQALCHQDPALAATLFRLANAAFYSGLTPVAGIKEALTRLGTEPVVAKIGQCCAEALAAPPGRLLPDYLPNLWRHSLGCAIGSGWLAERCGYRLIAEQAYLAGLLHDIGKFSLLAGLERLAGNDAIAALLVPNLMETILMSQHVETGLRLHACWGLPEAFAPTIGGHHDKRAEGLGLLTVLVRLANLGCHKLGLGGAQDSGLVLPTTAEAQFLGLDEIALAEFEIMLEDHPLLKEGLPWPHEGLWLDVSQAGKRDLTP